MKKDVPLTSSRRGRQHDRLKEHREEIHNRKVTDRDLSQAQVTFQLKKRHQVKPDSQASC
jgi:hypothetical protein